MSPPTPYDVLGVSRQATPAEIRRAYRRLARRCHPDVAPEVDPRQFRIVRDAYELLSDDRRRREYDRGLAVDATRRPWEPASFADDVDVDFPAVSALVGRIWDAFAGQAERPAPLRAEIELSPMEACQGARIPLAVPLRTVCRGCAGRGEVWLEVCRRCAGTGERTLEHRVTIVLPPGMTGGEQFAFTLKSATVPPTPIELRVAIR